MSTNKKADLIRRGEAWFNEWAIANTLSLKNVSKKQGFRVSCDNVRNTGFAVRKPSGAAIHFPVHPDGLRCNEFSPIQKPPSFRP